MRSNLLIKNQIRSSYLKIKTGPRFFETARCSTRNRKYFHSESIYFVPISGECKPESLITANYMECHSLQVFAQLPGHWRSHCRRGGALTGVVSF